jgi:hypothetical protein
MRTPESLAAAPRKSGAVHKTMALRGIILCMWSLIIRAVIVLVVELTVAAAINHSPSLSVQAATNQFVPCGQRSLAYPSRSVDHPAVDIRPRV